MSVHSLGTVNSLQAFMQTMIIAGKQAAGGDADFSQALVSVSVSLTDASAVSQPQEQTIDDVKKEFYDYLDSLAISPGLSNCAISVRVTDAAFEKMLVDPEYKQKMKDLCARDLCDPAWTRMAAAGISPSASVITIDADCEEEYLATSYNHPSQRGKADGDSFWSRRTQKNRDAREAEKERAREKREALELIQERAAMRNSWFSDLIAGDSGAKSFAASSVAMEGVTMM